MNCASCARDTNLPRASSSGGLSGSRDRDNARAVGAGADRHRALSAVDRAPAWGRIDRGRLRRAREPRANRSPPPGSASLGRLARFRGRREDLRETPGASASHERGHPARTGRPRRDRDARRERSRPDELAAGKLPPHRRFPTGRGLRVDRHHFDPVRVGRANWGESHGVALCEQVRSPVPLTSPAVAGILVRRALLVHLPAARTGGRTSSQARRVAACIARLRAPRHPPSGGVEYHSPHSFRRDHRHRNALVSRK